MVFLVWGGGAARAKRAPVGHATSAVGFGLKHLYINAIIWEILSTIGALDLAYVDADVTMLNLESHYTDDPLSPHDGLIAFRINPWDAFLLGQADEYLPSQPRREALFTIDEARRVRLLTDLLPNERLRLELVADAEDENSYWLDAAKLLAAVESGQKLDDLTRFLTENHQGQLPAPVLDWFELLRKNKGQFQEKGVAILVSVKRKALLEMVQGDEVLAKLCQPIDDTTIVIPSSCEKRFRARLKELGYLL